MESLILKRIAGLITLNAGLRVRESDYPHLAETLWKRAKSCGLHSLEEYYALLLKELETSTDLPFRGATASFSPPTKLEWHDLFTQLTINESYFFRDRHQFQLISQTILPELIERKRREHERMGQSGLPSLRIWSAGCSTGEEVYSIAIALNELNFPWQEWNTLLVGTDISITALSVAQRGSYGNWSFRQTDAALQNKYFRRHQQFIQLREDIRQRVIFQYGNLVKDNFPSPYSVLKDIDLILCRNVFIYFDSEAIALTLKKFHRTLQPEGYLITGHTELHGQDTSQFQIKVFSESLVYQRCADPPTTCGLPLSSHSKTPIAPPPYSPARPPVSPVPARVAPLPRAVLPEKATPTTPPTQPAAIALAQAQASLAGEAYAEAIRYAQQVRSQDPDHFEAQFILAQAYANIGNHLQAKEFCKQALSLQPLNLELHYLLAQIAEEEGNSDLAKEHLRRIIYIDAYAFKAYLDLASLYQQEQNLEQVNKLEKLALKTLNLLPETVVIDPETGSTVLEWRKHLEKKLSS